jgi:hypothetical protein
MATEHVLKGSKVTSLRAFYTEIDRAIPIPTGYIPNLVSLEFLPVVQERRRHFFH